jgi:transposase
MSYEHSAAQQAFDALVSRWRKLSEMHVLESQRFRRREPMPDSIRRHLEWLSAEIAYIEIELRGYFANRPEWSENDRLLQSVRGVDAMTSLALLIELPELGQASNGQISRLAGVVPGKTGGRELGSRATARAALFTATLVALRQNPVLRAYYRRRRAEGKDKMVVFVATAHKLIVVLNTVLRNRTPWEDRVDL